MDKVSKPEISTEINKDINYTFLRKNETFSSETIFIHHVEGNMSG